MSHPLPPKKEVALALLERSKVSVHLDPRKSGVIVPINFRKQPQLVLDIGLNTAIPIPDLRLDEEGMSCTLSFARQPFYCVIPWPSIFAMVGDDGRGMVWPDDVPPEIAPQPAAAARPAEQPAPRPRPQAAKRALQPVPDGAPALRAARSTPDEPAPPEKAAKGAKGKGSRSKKPKIAVVENPPERPVLVALPPPPEPRGPRAVPSEKKRPVPAPRPRPGASTAGKAKRELPPYLRVVK
jgi:stringent starvation protein B